MPPRAGFMNAGVFGMNRAVASPAKPNQQRELARFEVFDKVTIFCDRFQQYGGIRCRDDFPVAIQTAKKLLCFQGFEYLYPCWLFSCHQDRETKDSCCKFTQEVESAYEDNERPCNMPRGFSSRWLVLYINAFQ